MQALWYLPLTGPPRALLLKSTSVLLQGGLLTAQGSLNGHCLGKLLDPDFTSSRVQKKPEGSGVSLCKSTADIHCLLPRLARDPHSQSQGAQLSQRRKAGTENVSRVGATLLGCFLRVVQQLLSRWQDGTVEAGGSATEKG